MSIHCMYTGILLIVSQSSTNMKSGACILVTSTNQQKFEERRIKINNQVYVTLRSKITLLELNLVQIEAYYLMKILSANQG